MIVDAVQDIGKIGLRIEPVHLCRFNDGQGAGERFAAEFPDAATTASGLRVPKAVGDFLILDAVRASGGAAVAVSDEEMIVAARFSETVST